jgi:CheY-like chemotaxis protein
VSHANHARSRDSWGNRGSPQSLFRTRACIRARRTAASHNAVERGVCDDQRVRTTVLIVDDHQPFRESASALLESEGFAVVGAAADGAAALDAIERLRPEVVLLDIQLPDLDGFAVAERLAAAPYPPQVVLISSREAAAYGPRLTAAPARGFIPKRELSGAALAALVT